MTTTADPESVLELRQYTLVPGRRDDLVALFDTHFLESQDAVGGRVLGQFRDLDDPDRFVWVRAFADMTSRQRALEGFYGGPVWAAHCDAANVTVVEVPAGAEPDLVDWWTGQVEPAMRAAGGRPLGCLVTEPAVNTFPALPVREDAHVLAGVVAYDDDATAHRPEPPAGRGAATPRAGPDPAVPAALTG